MSKCKNINSTIIYHVLTITLDVSSIGTHTHLLALVMYYGINRLNCLQPKVLGIILMNLNKGVSKVQKDVTLSRIEAEYVAVEDALREIKI
jgi:hypothetical protein